MLDRITNFHNGSFLFIFALIIAYFSAIYLGDQLLLSGASIAVDASIAIFFFIALKRAGFLNSYWIYALLALGFWVAADVLLMFYDRLNFVSKNVSSRTFMQILFLVPFLMFFISFVGLFTGSLKKVSWQQLIADALVVIFIVSSFLWFSVFHMSFNVAFDKKYLLNLAYISIDTLLLCAVFTTFFLLRSRKRHRGLFLYLLAILFICGCDAYYSIRPYFGLDGADIHYESLFKIAFFIIFLASLHLIENEANIKIRLFRRDSQRVLLEKNAFLFILCCITLGATKTDQIYSSWIVFLLMTLLIYSAITYNISYSQRIKRLSLEERTIIKKLDVEIQDSLKELEEKNERLRQLSEFDSLTGLLNRQSFLSKLSEMIKTKALGEKIDIYCIDINHFKAINDSYGHYVGDEVLLKFSKNIKAILPEGAIVSRFGGDDFMIVLKQKNEGHYREFLYYLLNIIAEQISVGDYKIALGARLALAQRKQVKF